MNIIVYDDDLDFIAFMKESFNKLNLKHNGIFGTPSYYSKARDVLDYAISNKEKPSVFLLDIVSNDKQIGYILAERIKQVNIDNLIIHITDFREEILSNNMQYKINAFGFILKDSDSFFTELEFGILKAYNLLSNLYFTAKTNRGLVRRLYEDIYYFEKKKETANVIMYHKKGSDTFRESLISINNRTDKYFCYAAKEIIVNTKLITNIDKENGIIYFGDKAQCPFAKARKKELLKWTLQLL